MKKRITIHDSRRGPLAHFTADECIGVSLHRYGEWGEDELALLKPYISDGATVVDAGANVGTHTLGFARFVGPKGKVIAIEGQPETFGLLSHNLVSNNVTERVKAFNVLIGSRMGLVPVSAIPPAVQHNVGARNFREEVRFSRLRRILAVLRPQTTGKGPVVHLPLVTLDSLKLKRCDLIKIDVEGMELDVIKGARKTLKAFKPVVYFEYTTRKEWLLAGIFKIMKPLGYRFFWHIANPYNAANIKGDTHNIFGGSVEVNVFACPPGMRPPEGLREVAGPDDEPPRPPPEEAIKGVNLP